MKNSEIPLSLQVSKDVTEQEYCKANRQSTLLWAFTILFSMIPFFVIISIGPNIYDILILGIGGGIGLGFIVHIFMRMFIFPEAHKASTMRLQKYPELKKWREMIDKADHRETES